VRLDGTYLYASRAHERVLGYPPRTLLGTSAFALVHPADLAAVQAAITGAIRQRTSQRFEFRCRHADGHYIQLEAVGTLLLNDTDTPIGAVLSARDITERRRLEEEYRHAQKMEIVGRIAGGIAHDFNNVLTAVLGYSELLIEQHADNADLIADLREIQSAGERASRLTRQLLTFSRKQEVHTQVLDLNVLVGGIQGMVRRVIGEDVHTAVVFAPTPCPIKADPGQLEQVLMNLAVNARDAMPKGGQLTISTAHAELGRAFVGQHAGATPGPHVSLAVSDTGCGMSPDVIAHVFEPFFTTKPVGKGTGLGLATVHQIVKDAGGCVTIESTVGTGTTVTVFFPLNSESLAVSHSAGPDRAAPRGTETILLAEDDQVVRELMAKALTRLGYVVLVAEDAARAQALETTHDGPIQLLLSDIVMPGMNGPDLAQRLVRRRPDLQVLYVSGFASLGLRLGSISPHTAFLAKPFGPDRLAQKVREVLDRHIQPPVLA
jgi:PAS domain S-box-containing protein